MRPVPGCRPPRLAPVPPGSRRRCLDRLPRPAARPTARPAARLLAACLVLLAANLGAGVAAAEGTRDPATCFGQVRAAWLAASPGDVVSCMQSDGTVTLQLLAWPLSGKARVMKPEQAEATLKAYFKKLSGLALADVTPRRSPENLRLYEYTCKPEGENARTTHLQVQLRRDDERRWVLASITESPRPRN